MKIEILGKHYCNGDGKFRNVIRITDLMDSWFELEGYPVSEMETIYAAQ